MDCSEQIHASHSIHTSGLCGPLTDGIKMGALADSGYPEMEIHVAWHMSYMRPLSVRFAEGAWRICERDITIVPFGGNLPEFVLNSKCLCHNCAAFLSRALATGDSSSSKPSRETITVRRSHELVRHTLRVPEESFQDVPYFL